MSERDVHDQNFGSQDEPGRYGIEASPSEAQYDRDPAFDLEEKRPRTRRRVRGYVTLLAVIAIVAGVFLIPVPYVVSSPGPTYDVLGSLAGTPVIDIDDEQVADSSEGQLRMVTVTSRGGPGNRVFLGEYLGALLDPTKQVRPVEEVFPSNLTSEEIEEMSKIQMTSSQSTAAAAALEELGYEIGVKMIVAGATTGSHAEGLVEEGDILQAITTPDGVRHEVDRPSVPFALPKTLEPETPVTLEVLRDGEPVSIDMRTYRPEGAGEDFAGSRFGVYLSTEVELPIDVTVHLENVGGPSAGMIFALGIIDKLTGGDSTGGMIVSGTGAISYDGEVEPIGGIVQKMHGAKRDGAQWFLAPRANCDEVVGNIPEGLQVWPVGTLSEARAALKSIAAGSTVDHPVCEAK
ncbi:MAG: S16 family serine protease [Actinomycetaceae bacterium]|nr:S16 family serine protease [Actinomycetaceae bacterium]